jgi:DNA-binding transcriptional LysR family regulator
MDRYEDRFMSAIAEGASSALNTCVRRHTRTTTLRNDAMARPDLNLLVTLDVLLAEGSVARAARRLRLSPSAMSRALARLREATGDPLLAKLLARISTEAPGVRLRFLPKPDKDSAPLRDGTVDLETGVVGKTTGPEVRTQALFRDRFIGVVRTGHPLSKGDITPERYAAGRHIRVSRRGIGTSPIDEALALQLRGTPLTATSSGSNPCCARLPWAARELEC